MNRADYPGHSVTCPSCGVAPREDCVTPKGNPSPSYTHRARLDKVRRIADRKMAASRYAPGAKTLT